MSRRLLALVAVLLSAGTACNSDNGLHEHEDPPPAPVTGPQPDIKLEPESLGFGYVLPGCSSSQQTLTIRNVGDRELILSGITLAGDGVGSYSFPVTPALPTLASGETTTVLVDFAPSVIGDFSAQVHVASNDPDTPDAQAELVGYGSEEAFSQDIFHQPTPEAVDVLWVIDNSGSMAPIVNDMSDQFHVFIQNFVNLGLDYQMGVVTTDMVDPTHSGRLQGGLISPTTVPDVVTAFTNAASQGSSGADVERGLDAAYAALSEPLRSTTSAGLVRPNANFAVIVVSDEEDQSVNTTPAAFISFMDALTPDPSKTAFSAVVGPDLTAPGSPMTCGSGLHIIAGSERYTQVVHATGGHYSSLCNLDFRDVLNYLSYNAAGLSAEFPLRDTPTNVTRITVTVNGVPVSYSGIDGFVYSFSSNSITFAGSSIPGPNAEVIVTYPVQATCQ